MDATHLHVIQTDGTGCTGIGGVKYSRTIFYLITSLHKQAIIGPSRNNDISVRHFRDTVDQIQDLDASTSSLSFSKMKKTKIHMPDNEESPYVPYVQIVSF